MAIDAGPDQSVAVHSPTRFRATFTPPEGMDQHSITWDFGDGSEPVYIGRTAPTTTEGERVTATVTHSYDDPKDSPFIVQVSISSFGESGVAEGEDTLIVSVSEIPVIEVYAGNDINAVQNEEVVFTGSFTRPVGLTNVRYEWDFGDGSPIFEGEVSEGTRVAMTHSYADFRPDPYRARLTIIADSAIGEVSASQDIYVFVDEELGLVAGGFDVGDTGKTAVRTLTLVVSGLTTVIIWIGVFAFIWVPLAVLIVFLVRRGRRFRAQNPTGNPNPPDAARRTWSRSSLIMKVEITRHFTATGFVVHRGCIALHWHPKVKAWLSPGGHIEPNEDPVQAVKREVLEETGLEVEVLNTGAELRLPYPLEVVPPYTIMVEDIHDPVQGFHKHIDMIYFCQPTGETGLPDGWLWVSKEALENNIPLDGADAPTEPPPEDVRALGLRAIDFMEASLC